MSASHTTEITRFLAERTGTDPADWFLVFKARYGMEVVLRAIAGRRGPGSVTTQIFTCATAVNPIVVAGLSPVYGEVSPSSIALDPATLPVGEATRAVMLQHTFGIIDDDAARQIQRRTRQAGAFLLEDSAHCVGRIATDESGAPLADVSFHSFGVEKMLSTRFGGAVWVNPDLPDAEVRAQIVADLAALKPIGRRLDLATRAYRTQIRVLNRLPGGVARPIRNAMTALGLFEPAIAPVEQRGGQRHPAQRPSAWVLTQIAQALPTLAAQEARRSAAASFYAAELTALNSTHALAHTHLHVPDGARSGPLVRFPFFAPDEQTADRMVAALTAGGIYAGRWYRPALFPGATDPKAYGYTPGDGTVPVTEDLISRVVNLPTAVDLDRAARAIQIIRDVIDSAGSDQT